MAEGVNRNSSINNSQGVRIFGFYIWIVPLKKKPPSICYIQYSIVLYVLFHIIQNKPSGGPNK